ncbi:DNA-directed RNA polymerase subunit delta [Lentibacillus sp.]|uniref:DNA-directed RNA polymerase subunit delta n=1 Tax=Lentibacillus sp. TaxID=1925746 RepID=UPI002B4B848B|nr:DNA-directed RNA polymerase subunit delta [Lentibacillus sp.]HLS09956.1 DNA-directed RNA polymerase subunit delta [Lentibacillus sp.]
MSLENYSREELEVTSMVELANDILQEEQKAQDFNELYSKVAEMKGFTEEQKREFIAQFYTDLTIDGRFLTIESGVWGLKRWYPVEQMNEFVTTTVPKKKKKAKKKKEDIPRQEPEEEDLDSVDDHVEFLTNDFEKARAESDELDEREGFDDELDDDEFDDEDFDDEDEVAESDDEENNH